MTKESKNILICPLDWGLGHATRCVPIINELLRLGFKVLIGADKNPLTFLKQEFPTLKTVVIPGYEVAYNEKGSFFKVLTESVRFNNYIKKEHALIDQIIEEHDIDLLISDNRYGLYSDKVKSIIVTHQLYPKVPLGSFLVHKKIEKLISNFDECWIPDVGGASNLSGDLSHLKLFKHPHQFIGSLSRFSSKKVIASSVFEYDIIAILSGPEPQRTIFEKLIFEQIKKYQLKAVIVRGLPSKNEIGSSDILSCNDEKIRVFNHLSTERFLAYIQKSKVVVCRAGYSSVMDLAALNKQAILVPTPGQTEQEYLAQYHLNQGSFYCQTQKSLNLKSALLEVNKYNPKAVTSALSLDFLVEKDSF